MERKDFLKLCCNVLLEIGFRKKGSTHFYKDLSDEIMIVVGLCHSKYESKYWFDGGFVIKPINKHMPSPKYYDVNIRAMDIGINGQYYIEYLTINQNSLNLLKNSMISTFAFYSDCNDKLTLMNKIIITDSYELCKDYDIQNYFEYSFSRNKIIPDESQIN